MVVVNRTIEQSMLEIILDVLWPFEDAIDMRCMNILLITDLYEDF